MAMRVALGRFAVSICAGNASLASRVGADYQCDGTADDVQINAALTALPATGGTVLLSEGDFDVSAALVGKNYAVVEGAGQTATTLHWTGAAATHALDLASTNLGVLRNLKLTGPTANIGERTGYGIKLHETFSWKFENVMVSYFERGVTHENNAGDNTWMAPYINNCDVGMLCNSLFNRVLGGTLTNCETGVTNSASGGAAFIGVTFNGAEAVRNIDLPYYGEFNFTDNWFESSSEACARIGNGTTGPDGTKFIGNHLHTVGPHELDLAGGPNRTLVIGNVFAGPKVVDIAASHYYATFFANHPNAITINDASGISIVHDQSYPPAFNLNGTALKIGGNVGFYGHATVAQPAAPVTLADVIAIIRGNGMSA